MGDDELLDRFTRDNSQQAFQQIVDRYAALVFSTAKRHVGSPQLAEEITQNVFTALARKANTLDATSGLAGWLHRAAMLESKKTLRTEYRRKRRMDKLAELESNRQDGPTNWDQVMPEVDAALHRLADDERDLILQHYVEQRTYAEIATATGRSQAACAKQASRVLAKLAGLLKRQGVTLSATALAAGLASDFVHPAPAALVSSLAKTALASAATAAPATTLAAAISTMKLTTITVLVATGAAIPLGLQWATAGPANARQPSAAPAGLPTPESPDRPSTLVTHPNTSSEAERIDLQLLERELRSLPFPDHDVARALDLERLMFQLGEQDVPVVAALLHDLDPQHIGRITEALFARWAEFAPSLAATAAEDMPHQGLVHSARQGVMINWSASDPQAALNYLASHPNAKKASSMIWATVEGMVDRDPLAAITRISESITDPDARENITKIALQAWGENDPDAALAFVDDTGDELTSRLYSKALLERIAYRHPEKAFALAITSPHKAIRADTARWTLMQWHGNDPVAAAEAYASMPAELFADEQMSRTSIFIAGELAKRDMVHTLALADQIPEGRPRNTWLYAAAWELAATSPPDAAQIAASLPKGGNRRNALDRIAAEWKKTDPAAAQQWMETSGFFKNPAAE